VEASRRDGPALRSESNGTSSGAGLQPVEETNGDIAGSSEANEEGSYDSGFCRTDRVRADSDSRVSGRGGIGARRKASPPTEERDAKRAGKFDSRLRRTVSRVLQITPQMRILVAIEAVDGRKGIDSLVQLCRERLGTDPFSGCLFVFRSRSATSIRVLAYDGQGFWLAQKRLSKGRFL